MKLSILICSIEERKDLLQRLLNILEKQRVDGVEILLNVDNKEKTIGKKRNELLALATGDYIAFIDDDDTVSNDYVIKVLNASKSNPDCIGIEGIITTNGLNPKKFIHSQQYSSWFTKNNIYYRCPNHLNPIKRDIAIAVGFPEINHGEDKSYSDGVYKLIKTEVYINNPIYFYQFVCEQKSNAVKPARLTDQIKKTIIKPPKARHRINSNNVRIIQPKFRPKRGQ